eukprot:scaffold2816_cov121-Cylindrotheca_fusiformis.AAC.2
MPIELFSVFVVAFFVLLFPFRCASPQALATHETLKLHDPPWMSANQMLVARPAGSFREVGQLDLGKIQQFEFRTEIGSDSRRAPSCPSVTFLHNTETFHTRASCWSLFGPLLDASGRGTIGPDTRSRTAKIVLFRRNHRVRVTQKRTKDIGDQLHLATSGSNQCIVSFQQQSNFVTGRRKGTSWAGVVMADDETDSDEWGTEELVIPSKQEASGDSKEDEDDDDWEVKRTAPKPVVTKPGAAEKSEGEPMIIVDITQLDESIHSKFDRNSVNNAEAASSWRRKIESNYESYVKDAALLADATVIPCGSSVWRDALVRLRDERPGHYFCPIFSPKK